MKEKSFKLDWAGRELKITFGVMAGQTNASCLVQYGQTQVLATAVISDYEREGMSFFPLLVDYEEKMYAAGKIKGSRFIKRETRPSEEAVLTGRMIDRTIRPLFDDSIRRDIQVVVTVLSVDGENAPDTLGIIAAACALNTSDIPWAGPIGGVRVAMSEEGEFIINPSNAQRDNVKFEIMICGDGEKTIMIECAAKEAKEEDVFAAIKKGQTQLKPLIGFFKEIRKEIGIEKIDFQASKTEEQKEQDIKKSAILGDLQEFIKRVIPEKFITGKRSLKKERKHSLAELKEDAKVILLEKGHEEDLVLAVLAGFKELVEVQVSEAIIKEGKRVDGRKLDEVRPLAVRTSLLERVHGSALFTRGETQVLSVVTLGSPGDEQILDGMEESGKKRYMHHYNFPGYSVGEVKPFRGASRRDIGHGALAEKALVPVLPDKVNFPYTIRVVSETMSSNGSSSMASVCGSSLSLMDSGVPIKRAVAGVAMGLCSDKQGNYKIVTDLQDLEDSEGGMDFKVAGTAEGITAIQLDTKTYGLSLEIVEETLKKAKVGRMDVLDVMSKEISEPRSEMSPYAPRIETISIDPEKIRDVIGPGGKVINEIIEKTGVQIDIDQDGTVFVCSADAKGLEEAKEIIHNITREVEVGEVFDAKVVRIMDFGAFCELIPGKDGLLHISEINHERVNKVTDVLNIGDIVKVKVISIDDQGRVSLSARVLLSRPKGGPSKREPHKPSDGSSNNNKRPYRR